MLCCAHAYDLALLGTTYEMTTAHFDLLYSLQLPFAIYWQTCPRPPADHATLPVSASCRILGLALQSWLMGVLPLQAPLRNPVMTVDGHLYDRARIEEWFQKHDTSPFTGEKLSDKTLTPRPDVKLRIKQLEQQLSPAARASYRADL